MRILLVYDNFIRDYRGFLLLAEFLKKMNHMVWIYPGWNNPLVFADLLQINVLVVGQVGENATAIFGKYCTENNVHLVINSSEPITAISYYNMLVSYNAEQSNQDLISIQTIGTQSFKNYVETNSEISKTNKLKYKFIGFPRIDIPFHSELRNIETEIFINKYGLKNYKKVYIFISSFLFESSFEGITEKDLKQLNYDVFKIKNEELKLHSVYILERFIKESLKSDEIFLIKKHPWDCSSFWEDFCIHDNCKVVNNTEFITTCIDACDVMIHTHSTSAIEAWVMKKKTVAIYLEKYKENNIIHMEFEKVAYDYNNFIEYLSDNRIPDFNNSTLFNGKMDGKATYRLAEEINKLKITKKYKLILNFKVNRKLIQLLKNHWKIDNGKLKYDVDKIATKGTKYYDFLCWENQRSIVNTLYKKKIRFYVNTFLN